MSYTVSFYGVNSQNLPSGHPAVLNRFDAPPYISGSGYYLADQSYYTGELTEDYINSNKSQFGIGDGQRYFTQSSYDAYMSEAMPLYEAWRNSNQNPTVKEQNIKQIKNLAQEKIVGKLGYSVSDANAYLVKQINMNARASEIILGIIQGIASQSDVGELLEMKSFFSGVKDVRNYSNYLEGVVSSGLDISITEGWPPL